MCDRHVVFWGVRSVYTRPPPPNPLSKEHAPHNNGVPQLRAPGYIGLKPLPDGHSKTRSCSRGFVHRPVVCQGPRSYLTGPCAALCALASPGASWTIPPSPPLSTALGRQGGEDVPGGGGVAWRWYVTCRCNFAVHRLLSGVSTGIFVSYSCDGKAPMVL